MNTRFHDSLIMSIVFCFCLFLNPGSIFSQEMQTSRKVGLSAGFYNDQTDIMLPVWVSPKIVLAPSVSALWVEDGGTDLGFGIAFRFYHHINKVSPYFGARLGVLVLSPKGRDSVADFVSGVMLGGEYFLCPQFSLGIEAQVNATFSNDQSSRFGNPGGMNINTGSVIIASIYL
jgi:hypothetical protein